MKYAMCPNCGRRLCKGEPGTTVEIECPKCGETAVVVIKNDDMRITKLIHTEEELKKIHA